MRYLHVGAVAALPLKYDVACLEFSWRRRQRVIEQHMAGEVEEFIDVLAHVTSQKCICCADSTS